MLQMDRSDEIMIRLWVVLCSALSKLSKQDLRVTRERGDEIRVVESRVSIFYIDRYRKIIRVLLDLLRNISIRFTEIISRSFDADKNIALYFNYFRWQHRNR